MIRVCIYSSAAVLMLLGSIAMADVKSGPEVGKGVGAFNPTHVTGPDAGKSSCPVWKNGGSPVVAIFAREIDDNLTSLVKKVNKATKENSSKDMGSFVIFLTDDKDEMEKKIKSFADKNGISGETPLAMDNVAGPKSWNLSKDANVTVLLYSGRKVKANFAFEKGKMKEADIEKIMKELPKILE